MSSHRTIKRQSSTGRILTSPLGKSKAAKFSAVEGMGLSASSAKQLSELKSAGLKGDALRSAISGSFKKTGSK